MMQWINLQNNMSVLWTVSAFIVLKTGPIHLVLVGLTLVNDYPPPTVVSQQCG